MCVRERYTVCVCLHMDPDSTFKGQAACLYLSIEAAKGLDQVGGPAHVQDRGRAPLLPLADAIVETQQVSKAFWVLEGGESVSLLEIGRASCGESV